MQPSPSTSKPKRARKSALTLIVGNGLSFDPAVDNRLLEDNPDDQELLHYELKKTPVGKHVLAVSDPRAALKLLQGANASGFRQHLLAIFLDVRLPHMSGIDLLRLIRKMDGMESFPIIVMTSSPPPETVAACRELKVMALLEKPITFSTFAKAIANLFHASQAGVP